MLWATDEEQPQGAERDEALLRGQQRLTTQRQPEGPCWPRDVVCQPCPQRLAQEPGEQD